jgi:hypothetical protein
MLGNLGGYSTEADEDSVISRRSRKLSDGCQLSTAALVACAESKIARSEWKVKENEKVCAESLIKFNWKWHVCNGSAMRYVQHWFMQLAQRQHKSNVDFQTGAGAQKGESLLKCASKLILCNAFWHEKFMSAQKNVVGDRLQRRRCRNDLHLLRAELKFHQIVHFWLFLHADDDMFPFLLLENLLVAQSSSTRSVNWYHERSFSVLNWRFVTPQNFGKAKRLLRPSRWLCKAFDMLGRVGDEVFLADEFLLISDLFRRPTTIGFGRRSKYVPNRG